MYKALFPFKKLVYLSPGNDVGCALVGDSKDHTLTNLAYCRKCVLGHVLEAMPVVGAQFMLVLVSCGTYAANWTHANDS